MMIKQIIEDEYGETCLCFGVIQEKKRTFKKGLRFGEIWNYVSRDKYLENNISYYSEFIFINKGDIDERTTRD